MHPREGWLGGGIRRKPSPEESAISRRQLLVAGAGLADLEKAPGVNAATARLVYDFFHDAGRG